MSKTQASIDGESLLIEDWKTSNKTKAGSTEDFKFNHY
jgi:hypothetical protein